MTTNELINECITISYRHYELEQLAREYWPESCWRAYREATRTHRERVRMARKALLEGNKDQEQNDLYQRVTSDSTKVLWKEWDQVEEQLCDMGGGVQCLELLR